MTVCRIRDIETGKELIYSYVTAYDLKKINKLKDKISKP